MTAEPLGCASDVVTWLGAVQAQDYLCALWAVGLRTRGATEGDVERALAERSIVRTWPMRGTLHLVPAADARWMLALLTPRVVARSAARLRSLAIDDAVLARSADALTHALRGGLSLTRDATYAALREAGISTAGQRGVHVVARLAQDGLICFAARDGRQQTFALLEEWVPRARTLGREEALAELAARYFRGHGPATLDDLAWWSGLPLGDARAAVELARRRLVREVVGGRELWRGAAATAPGGRGAPRARLLPAFDELLVGYRDRAAVLDPRHAERVHHLLSPTIVMGGRVVGTWSRSFRGGDTVAVRATFFEPGAPARTDAFAAAAEEYGAFVGRRVVLP